MASIARQTVDDWQVMISYEGDINGGEEIARCIDKYPGMWNVDARYSESLYKYDTRSRYEAMLKLDPADDDIIITLDLDGDQLAHPQVLEHLLEYYSDDTLLTYGSYEPVPYADGCPPAIPFPPDVIASNSYRHFIAAGGPCSFNHLRTMKGKVFKAIPIEQFQWSNGRGWYRRGCDYQFTVSGLELAGRRHKCISEVLAYYNSANQLSAWRIAPADSDECNVDFLHRHSPLQPL